MSGVVRAVGDSSLIHFLDAQISLFFSLSVFTFRRLPTPSTHTPPLVTVIHFHFVLRKVINNLFGSLQRRIALKKT